MLVVSGVVIALLATTDADADAARRRCRGGKVPVTVRGKTTCRPLAKAIPKPKRIDVRLAYLLEGLSAERSGLRSPAAKHALAEFQRLLPRGLVLIDQHRPAAARFARAGPIAVAAAGCGLAAGTPAGDSGGLRVSASFGDKSNQAEGGTFDYSPGSGITVRTTYESCSKRTEALSDCPTANGDVRYSRTEHFETSTEVRSGERVLSRTSTTTDRTARVHGKVGDDARLEYLDIDDSTDTLIVSSKGVRRGNATRSVHVAMPSGSYGAGGSGVRYSGDPGAANSDEGAFAATVASVIQSSRTAEKDRWSNVAYRCAEPVFSPSSNTLKLQKGKTGSFTAYAKASRDGAKAAKARWTLNDQVNGTFSPATSRTAAPRFRYTVTAAPKGGKVRVMVRVTSPAGAGEKVWEQDVEGQEIKHIRGTIQGAFVESRSDGDSRLDWQGNAAFDLDPSSAGGNLLFKTASGDYTVTASGVGSFGCAQSGTKHFMLSAGDGSLFIPNLTTDPAPPPPYQYSFGAGVGGTQPTIDVLLSSCPDKERNGTTDTIPVPVVYDSNGSRTSSDGIDFSGSWSETRGTSTATQTWSFRGTP